MALDLLLRQGRRADEETPVELLSAVYQFGYRIASIVGGAIALVLAARMSWSLVYLLMGGLIGLMVLIALRAPDTPRPDSDRLHKELAEPGALEPRARAIALTIVGVAWAWAIVSIGRFMISMLTTAPPAILREVPDPAAAIDRYDPVFTVNETARVQLKITIAHLNLWQRRDLGRHLRTGPFARS